jgi:hypothetical protein
MGSSGDTGFEGNLGLAAFQLEVTRLFFTLPASKGFLLAGGAALLAQHGQAVGYCHAAPALLPKLP